MRLLLFRYKSNNNKWLRNLSPSLCDSFFVSTPVLRNFLEKHAVVPKKF